jgi:hypothetical protein
MDIERLLVALVLQHDLQPFSIDVHIDGRLHGEKNKRYRLFQPREQSNMKTPSRIVTPPGTHDFQLDEIASKLNSEMTTLNIRNYRSAARMALQHETLVTHHQKFGLEPKVKVNTDGSDTGHQSKRSGYTHSDYTVAWICALPIKMAAAKGMLDDIHDGLSVPLPPVIPINTYWDESAPIILCWHVYQTRDMARLQPQW